MNLSSEILWHSPRSNFKLSAKATTLIMMLKNHTFELIFISPGSQWVKHHYWCRCCGAFYIARGNLVIWRTEEKVRDHIPTAHGDVMMLKRKRLSHYFSSVCKLSTVHLCIPLQGPLMGSFNFVFVVSLDKPQQLKTAVLPINWDAMTFKWRHSNNIFGSIKEAASFSCFSFNMVNT